MKDIKKFILIAVILFFSLPIIVLLLNGMDIYEILDILKGSEFRESLLYTVEVLVITVLIDIIIGTPFAFAMEKVECKIKGVLEILIILPLIVPVLTITLGLGNIFLFLKIFPRILQVSIVHTLVTLPYYIYSVRIGYRNMSDSYFKLTKLYGMNMYSSFLKIQYPLLKSFILTGISFVILVSLGQYITTFILGGGRILTIPLVIMPYISNGDFKVGSSYSILYIVISYIIVKSLTWKVRREEND